MARLIGMAIHHIASGMPMVYSFWLTAGWGYGRATEMASDPSRCGAGKMRSKLVRHAC
jgi:hypothetical protein